MSYLITTIAIGLYDMETAVIFVGGVVVSKTIEWLHDEWMRRI